MDFKKLLKSFEECACGEKHECAIDEIAIGSGIVKNTGEILKRNGFSKNLLFVADKNTVNAANGIKDALKDFNVTYKIFDFLRVATMQDVEEIENYIKRGCDSVIAVGTGSVHDVSRLASANMKIKLCLFATAPSMDGFASYSAPIVNRNFKITYPAKCPEVIIGDTAILAASPKELKSAGFGDMVSKYIALIDWKVSHLITGEEYCDNVANLVKYAADKVVKMADRVTENDEESAKLLFEGLLLTGIAMSFTKTSRPGSGTEHIMTHYMECKELLEGKVPNFHGEDVGVTTLIMLKYYKELAKYGKIKAHKEVTDWDEVYKIYGELAGDVKKLNEPDTITDGIDPKAIEDNFEKIKEIIGEVPEYGELLAKMKIAGCKTTAKEIGKTQDFIEESFKYHPYMRRRLSLRRLKNMFDKL